MENTDTGSKRSLLSMARNDEQAAMDFAVAASDAGEFTPEAAQILLMLQDDPASLQEKLQVMMEGSE